MKRTWNAALLMVLCGMFFAAAPNVWGQCSGVCGDVDNNGTVSINDIIYAQNFLYADGPAPECPDQADFDGYEMLNLMDLQYGLDTFLAVSDPASVIVPCPPANPVFVPPVDSGTIIRSTVPGTVRNAESDWIPLLLITEQQIRGFSMVLEFRVGDDIPAITLEELGDWLTGSNFDAGITTVTDDSGRVMISARSITSPGIPPGTWLLAELRLEFPLVHASAPITVNYTTYPPEQSGQNTHSTVFIPDGTDYGSHHVPYMAVGCCDLRGDANHDGAVTVSDVTFMVDFLFRSGGPGFCPEELDIWGNGSVSVSGLTRLVDYLFRSGSAPAQCP